MKRDTDFDMITDYPVLISPIVNDVLKLAEMIHVPVEVERNTRNVVLINQ